MLFTKLSCKVPMIKEVSWNLVIDKFIEHYYAIVSVFADFTTNFKDVILLALIPLDWLLVCKRKKERPRSAYVNLTFSSFRMFCNQQKISLLSVTARFNYLLPSFCPSSTFAVNLLDLVTEKTVWTKGKALWKTILLLPLVNLSAGHNFHATVKITCWT